LSQTVSYAFFIFVTSLSAPDIASNYSVWQKQTRDSCLGLSVYTRKVGDVVSHEQESDAFLVLALNRSQLYLSATLPRDPLDLNLGGAESITGRDGELKT
jgi:hypothetical protein